jgi:hypothetical protein
MVSNTSDVLLYGLAYQEMQRNYLIPLLKVDLTNGWIHCVELSPFLKKLKIIHRANYFPLLDGMGQDGYLEE